MKAATVAIVGRPSSGKSTLINALCGNKVSIVSAVPQTTRNRIRGILTTDDGQIVFLDTPGLHLSEKRLNTHLSRLVSLAIDEVDILLYLVDGSRAFGPEERAILAAVARSGKPTVVCVNKKDRGGNEREKVMQELSAALKDARPVEISALRAEGIDEVIARLFQLAPEGDPMYPSEFYTDQSPEFRIAEVIREKAILKTRQEVPHALYVRLEDLEMRDDGSLLWARGFLCVERDSQKGILVGKAGERIKSIVEEAERELSELFPYRVKLDLRVKVDRDWRKRDSLLKRMIQ